MDLNELYNLNRTQTINEAPYGMGSRLHDNTIGKIFNRDGAKGNKEAGTKANAMMKQFRRYVGSVVGTGQSTIEGRHLIDFLQNQNVDTQSLNIQPNDQLTPSDAEKHMFSAARTLYSTPNGDRYDRERARKKETFNRAQELQSRARTDYSDTREPQAQQELPQTSKKKRAPKDVQKPQSVEAVLNSLNSLTDEELKELLNQL